MSQRLVLVSLCRPGLLVLLRMLLVTYTQRVLEKSHELYLLFIQAPGDVFELPDFARDDSEYFGAAE